MLSEAFKYLTTPCAPHLKSMGYLKELIALEARFQRCQMAWEAHLEQTKSVITDAVNATSHRNKVVVLGCGILSDIPIKTLSESFETVVLVDVCFLEQTRKNARPYTNIEWRECDITGVAHPLYAWATKSPDTDDVPVPSIPRGLSLDDADLVISANILSQLPLIPTAFLRKTPTRLREDTLSKFSRDIVQSHLAFLETCPGTVCLITEIERQFRDGADILETEDPLWGYRLEYEGAEWVWDLAPRGEASPKYEIRNRVIGSYRQSS